MLTRPGRMARRVATVATAAALLAGTIAGQDDHFPFGPFRMYSTATAGSIPVLKLEGTTAAGRTLPINFWDLGLRRAEVDGQLPLFRADPDRLRYLAVAWARHHGPPRLVALRLYQEVYPLIEGRPGEPSTRTIALWTAR